MSNEQTPSLLGAHVQYVKGAIEVSFYSIKLSPGNRWQRHWFPCLDRIGHHRQASWNRRDESSERESGPDDRWVWKGRGACREIDRMRGHGEGGR